MMSTADGQGHVLGELGAYVLGGLRSAEAADVGAHLRVCARCRAEYDHLAAVPDWLCELPAADALGTLEPPEN
ncbi:MAG: zf-HC2 domain-containing protein [Trebonia sp.]